MTVADSDILEIPLRDQWLRLPSHDQDPESGMVRLLESLAVERTDVAARLEFGLRAVSSVAAGLPAGSRESRALVRNPASGHVDALLSVRIRPVEADGYDSYLAAAQALAGNEEVELIRRQVEEVRLPLGRGVLSHDFAYPLLREGVPAPAMERTFLGLFPDSQPVCLEFTLLTQDFALFSDAPAFLLELAVGDNPPIPGMDQE